MTEALAIWGAALSSVLAFVTVRRELRDRPRLTLRLRHVVEWTDEEVSSEDYDQEPEFESVTLAHIHVDVINVGLRPAMVVDVELENSPGQIWFRLRDTGRAFRTASGQPQCCSSKMLPSGSRA